MEFISSLPPVAKFVVFLIFVVWGFKLWSNWRKAKTGYRDIPYQSNIEDGEVGWSWVTPPEEVGLTVEQTEDNSTLKLNPVRSSNEVLFGSIGLALAAFTFYLVALTVYRGGSATFIPPAMTYTVIGVLGLLAYGLCCTDAPVTDIFRSETALVVRSRFATFFHRKKTYSASKAGRLSFTGDLQSFLEMNTDQLDRLPDFYLYAKQPFRSSRRFLLRTNPAQTSWIIGGLNQWIESRQQKR